MGSSHLRLRENRQPWLPSFVECGAWIPPDIVPPRAPKPRGRIRRYVWVTSLGVELVFWIVLPALVALGAAYLVWLLMQARIQVLTAHFQTAVAKVEGDCNIHRPRADDLLAELRIERRRFLRRVPGPKGNESTLITQERLYLRNLPLTSWMQEEVPLGTGEELPAESSLIPLIESPTSQSLTVPLPVR